MSQVLNFLWVLFSIWVLLRWLCRSSNRSSARRVGLSGLVCVLVLLFPVISANDDLLLQRLMNAPVSPVVKVLPDGTAFCESGTTPLAAVCCALFPSRAAQNLMGDEPAVFLSSVSIGGLGDRSPPLFT